MLGGRRDVREMRPGDWMRKGKGKEPYSVLSTIVKDVPTRDVSCRSASDEKRVRRDVL